MSSIVYRRCQRFAPPYSQIRRRECREDVKKARDEFINC